MNKRSPAAHVTALCLLSMSVCACVTVPPYQRETLTRPGMNASLEADAEVFQAHVDDSRQGAAGSRGSTGGGCGCN